MEDVARQALAAIACWLAGPLAGLAAIHLAAGAVVDQTVTEPTNVGAAIGGLIVAGLVLGGIGVLVGAAATAAALLLSHTPHPGWAAVACLLLAVVWGQVVLALEVAVPTTAVLLGLVPAVVRFVDGLTPAGR
jgi:hypothetical protein